MKYPTHIYAKALADVIRTSKAADSSKIVKNFIRLVQKNGDDVHLEKILEETARFARKNSGVRKIVIESARELSPQGKKKVSSFTKLGDVVVENIVPDLVAGIRVIIDDEIQLDETLKGKLDKVFANI